MGKRKQLTIYLYPVVVVNLQKAKRVLYVLTTSCWILLQIDTEALLPAFSILDSLSCRRKSVCVSKFWFYRLRRYSTDKTSANTGHFSTAL